MEPTPETLLAFKREREEARGGVFGGAPQQEDSVDMEEFQIWLGQLVSMCHRGPQKQVVIMRGIPGCGKSTVAAYITETIEKEGFRVKTVSADAYFSRRGLSFVASSLHLAHQECQREFKEACDDKNGPRVVIVDNTNILQQHWEAYEHKAARMWFVEFEALTQDVCLWMAFRSSTPTSTVTRYYHTWQENPFSKDPHRVVLMPVPVGYKPFTGTYGCNY